MSSRTSTEPAAVVARFALPIYLVSVLCIVAPPLDMMLSLPTLDVASVRWRFGAVGLLTGTFIIPLLGLLIAVVTAVICRHRWLHRFFMLAGWLAAGMMLAALGLFVLDALQVRSQIPEPNLRRFDITVLKATLMQVAQLVTLVMILWAGLRTRIAAPTRAEDPSATLVGTSTISSSRR